MAGRKARRPSTPIHTPCRWVDCIYWGIVDETGSPCDEYQAAVCEKIRTEAERSAILPEEETNE